jgi:Uncharacterized protein conserved in bacteria
MEIERKFLIEQLPQNLEQYSVIHMEQGYLSTEPVIRIRKENDEYVLTYKSKGFLVREEHNLPLTKESYEHLKTKIDGTLIKKCRYLIPFTNSLCIELDVFEGKLSPLMLAEVEFPDLDHANAFVAPDWFGEEVTYETEYHNNYLCTL